MRSQKSKMYLSSVVMLLQYIGLINYSTAPLSFSALSSANLGKSLSPDRRP